MKNSFKIIRAFVCGLSLFPSVLKASDNDVASQREVQRQSVKVTRSSPVSFTDAMPKFIENSFKIQNAQIEGTNLWVAVSYGGGCKPQHFSFQVWSAVQESYPPRTIGAITKQGEEDNCERFMRENIKFDLRPIIEHVGKMYSAVPPVFLLRLNGYGLVSLPLR